MKGWNFKMNKELLKEFLPDNPIILEAGAYDGNDTIDFISKFPNCTIYAFEPIYSIYKKLNKNVQSYKNIITFNLALDDVSKYKDMYVSSGYSTQSSSLMKPLEHLNKFPDCKFDTKEIVQTITINDFIQEIDVERIDMMWLDLQGNEYKVLSQADKILHTTKCIYAEYSLIEFYEGLMLHDDFTKHMNELGFIEKYRYSQYDELGCGNSLYVRRDINE